MGASMLTSDRMGRLQHLPRILRMEVRVVVVHALCDFEQHTAEIGGVVAGARGCDGWQVREALIEPFERFAQQGDGILVELESGHESPCWRSQPGV